MLEIDKKIQFKNICRGVGQIIGEIEELDKEWNECFNLSDVKNRIRIEETIDQYKEFAEKKINKVAEIYKISFQEAYRKVINSKIVSGRK